MLRIYVQLCYKENDMRKYLFLDTKNTNFCLDDLVNLEADSVMVSAYDEEIDIEFLEKLRKCGFRIGLCTSVYDQDCLANPIVETQIEQNIQRVISFHPDEIWIDHLRFHGHWENKDFKVNEPHKECSFCKKRSRKEVVLEKLQITRNLIPTDIKLGFFAVPYFWKAHSESLDILGFDYSMLVDCVDSIGPMLYHRMLGKPTVYINEYCNHLSDLGFKDIIPLIQVKDMPENSKRDYSDEEFSEAYVEASKPPSSGVAFFTWNHAIEKGRTENIRQLFSKDGI